MASPEGRAASAASASSSLSLASPTSTPIPESFDHNTLRDLCNVKNGSWTCFICHKGEKNVTRLPSHMIDSHSSRKGLLPIVRAYVNHYCRQDKRPALLQKIDGKLGVTSQTETKEPTQTIPTMFKRDGSARQVIVDGMAMAVIDGALPLSICDAEWPSFLIDAGIQVAWDSLKTKPTGRMPKSSDYQIDRKMLTEAVDDLCNAEIEQAHQTIKDCLQRLGGCLISGGRSNIANDPTLVFAIQTNGFFMDLKSLNAKEEKKDAAYLVAVHKSVLNESPEIARNIIACASDGAASCIKACEILEREEYLLAVRCQSHALNLLIKDMATSVFKSVVDQAGSIIDWVRSRQRLNSLLQVHSKGLAIFRFIDTRFGTYVTASKRLLVLKPHFGSMLLSPEYDSYSKEQGRSTKELFQRMYNLVVDAAFWDRLQLFVNTAEPVMIALRLMDQSNVRAKDVLPIWDALRNRLSVILYESTLERADKKKVFQLFLSRCAKSINPVFDAAWVLDPANITRVRALTAGTVDNEASVLEWNRKNSNTRKCLQTLAKRTCLVRSRYEQSKVHEAKKRKVTEDVAEGLDEAVFDGADAGDKLFDAMESAIQAVDTAFSKYCLGVDEYADVSMVSELDWAKVSGRLQTYALRIINISATTSNIERMHKVYASVHTGERSRLDRARVDRLILARSARATRNRTPPFNHEALSKFTSLSDEELTTISDFYESLTESAADPQPNQNTQESNQDLPSASTSLSSSAAADTTTPGDTDITPPVPVEMMPARGTGMYSIYMSN